MISYQNLTYELFDYQKETINLLEISDFGENFEHIYLVVTNYLFHIGKNGNFVSYYTKVSNGNLIEMSAYNILLDKCYINDSHKYCDLYLVDINLENYVNIIYFIHDVDRRELNMSFNRTIPEEDILIKNKNIICQMMYNSTKDEKLMTCFYVNIEHQLQTIFFYPLDPSSMEINFGSVIELFDPNVTYLKAALYSNNSKAIVCFISNENSLKYAFYDIVNDVWSDYIYVLIDECYLNERFFSYNYYSSTNQHIFSCYNKSNYINAAILDLNNYDDSEDLDYYLSSFNLDICPKEDDLSFVLNSLTKYTEAIIGCDNGTFYNIYTMIDSELDIELESTENKISDAIDSTYGYITIMNSFSDMTNKYMNNTDIYQNIIQNDTNNISEIINNNISNIIIEKYIFPNVTNKISEIINNKTIEDLKNNIDELLEEIEIGKVYKEKGKDFEVKISPINNNENNNDSNTYINFLNCENSLRTKYKISNESILTVVQFEIYNNEKSSLTNQVEYSVYSENKTFLNLSVCEKDKIKIIYAISNDSLLNFDEITYFNNMGVDIFNSKDQFFNDICYPYSNNSNDMILKDRIKDIYKNYSLCDNNCKYNKMNITIKTVSCFCNVKTKIDTNKPPLKFDKIYLNLFSDTIFGVIKCYNLVLDIGNKINNYGFLIFSTLIALHIPIIVAYIIKGTNPIKQYLIKEMEKYDYLPHMNYPPKKMKHSRTKKKLRGNSKNQKNLIKEVNSIIEEKIPNNNKTSIHIFNLQKSENDNFELKEKNKSMSTNKFNKLKDKLKINDNVYYNLIKIDANNLVDNSSHQSKYFLDIFEYEEAIYLDKRSFCRIFYICLLSKENILNTFFLKCPLELVSIKLCSFIFSYSCDLALNTLFYFSENISDKYNYKGQNIFWFNILNNLTISFISSIISFVIVVILQQLINSKDSIEDLFKVEEKKLKEDKNYIIDNATKIKLMENIFLVERKIKCKTFIFILLEIFIMIFFYYFSIAFCEVYKKTQGSWLIDSLVSFLISFPVEFLLSLMISVFYFISIKLKIKLFYRISLLLYNFG